MGHEVCYDEDDGHKHGEQGEGRRVGAHYPNDEIADLVKQPAFPYRAAQRAAAAQQQQHVPVQRPEVRHVENAAAVQHLWAQREWRRAQHCMVGVRVQHCMVWWG